MSGRPSVVSCLLDRTFVDTEYKHAFNMERWALCVLYGLMLYCLPGREWVCPISYRANSAVNLGCSLCLCWKRHKRGIWRDQTKKTCKIDRSIYSDIKGLGEGGGKKKKRIVVTLTCLYRECRIKCMQTVEPLFDRHWRMSLLRVSLYWKVQTTKSRFPLWNIYQVRCSVKEFFLFPKRVILFGLSEAPG